MIFRAENSFGWAFRAEHTVEPGLGGYMVWAPENTVSFAALGEPVPVPGYICFGARHLFAGGVFAYELGTAGALTGNAVKWGTLLDAGKDETVEEVVITDAVGNVLAAGGTTESHGVSLHIRAMRGQEPAAGDAFSYEGREYTVFNVRTERATKKVKELVVTGKRWKGLEGAALRKFDDTKPEYLTEE